MIVGTEEMTQTGPDALRPMTDEGRLRSKIRRYSVHYWPTAVSLVAVLALWEWLINFLEVPSYLVPTPTAVGRALVRGILEGDYLSHALVTLSEALSGFVVGSLSAIIIAIAITAFPLLDRILYPYIVALLSLPKIAVAPLIIVWFGFGISSKIVITSLVAFFPVLVNMISGLRAVEHERLQLLFALDASRFEVLRYVRFPSALPYLFAGLNTAIVFSVIGAIVGEFVGANRGLGVLILQANFGLNMAAAFALFVILSFMGVTLHVVMRTLQRKIVFWVDPDETVAP